MPREFARSARPRAHSATCTSFANSDAYREPEQRCAWRRIDAVMD